jgi:hypothetical protein
MRSQPACMQRHSSRKKVDIAAKLQDDHRLYVRAACADLKQHILNSRVAADERTKKKTMVLSQVRNNISNAQTFACQSQALDAAATTMRYSANLPNGQVEQTLSGTKDAHAAAAPQICTSRSHRVSD